MKVLESGIIGTKWPTKFRDLHTLTHTEQGFSIHYTKPEA